MNTPGETATDAGAYCYEGGEAHAPGASWTCSDGCNTCDCSPELEVITTDIACAPLGCEVDGKTYAVGAAVPSGDSCNTCGCNEGGGIVCTEAACPPAVTYSEWEECADEACLCAGLTVCTNALYEGALGEDDASSARICGKTADTCAFTYYVEEAQYRYEYHCEFARDVVAPQWCAGAFDTALALGQCTLVEECNILADEGCVADTSCDWALDIASDALIDAGASK